MVAAEDAWFQKGVQNVAWAPTGRIVPEACVLYEIFRRHGATVDKSFQIVSCTHTCTACGVVFCQSLPILSCHVLRPPFPRRGRLRLLLRSNDRRFYGRRQRFGGTECLAGGERGQRATAGVPTLRSLRFLPAALHLAMFPRLFGTRGNKQFQLDVPGQAQTLKPGRRSFRNRFASKDSSYHQSIKTMLRSICESSFGCW